MNVQFATRVDLFLPDAGVEVHGVEVDVDASVNGSDVRIDRVEQPCDPRHNKPAVDVTRYVSPSQRASLEQTALRHAEDHDHTVDRYARELERSDLYEPWRAA